MFLQDCRKGRKRAMTATAATPAGVRRCPDCHAKPEACACSWGHSQGGGGGGATKVPAVTLAHNPMYSSADEAHPAVAGSNGGGGGATKVTAVTLAHNPMYGSADEAHPAVAGSNGGGGGSSGVYYEVGPVDLQARAPRCADQEA
jgi:hypothetical protein